MWNEARRDSLLAIQMELLYVAMEFWGCSIHGKLSEIRSVQQAHNYGLAKVGRRMRDARILN